MKFHPNIPYVIATILLLTAEILIATFLKSGFIRHTFGDFLVVILLYCFIRSFIQGQPVRIAVFVLLFSYLVEFLQLFNLLDYLNLRDNELAVIILGSTFHTTDLIAYTLGVLTILVIDIKIKTL